jgi:hypothetical protein
MMKSRRMRCTWLATRMGEKINACKNLVGKPEGKRLAERRRCRRKDNIIMDLS